MANKIVALLIIWSYGLMTLPPLNGLLALEATARLKSVSLAARELGISQPAISQRLRALERHFGRKLIERTPTGFRMDAEVEAFAARLRTAVQDLGDASTAFRAHSQQAANRLTIALLATFAQRWLIPRLADFQQRHPELDVRLMTTSTPSDLERGDVDVSIRCGTGAWMGFTSELLLANRIFPVASPRYLAALPLRAPQDLARATCIRVDAAPRDADWPRWLGAAAVPDLVPKSWQDYANSTHAMEAATAGLGIAMAHAPFAADSLAAGRLVKPFATECDDTDGDYYVVHRSADVPRRVRQFRDWLLGQRDDASSRVNEF